MQDLNMNQDNPPILELRHISKWFGPEGKGIVAVDDCSLSVKKGEFICVVGPSGCGKSTLMTIAAGLEKPSRGEVLVEGRPAGPPGPKRSVVFQKFALFPSETVAQNIKFAKEVGIVCPPAVDIGANFIRAQHPRHTADVIGMRVGSDNELDFVIRIIGQRLLQRFLEFLLALRVTIAARIDQQLMRTVRTRH